jgi:hypothetical protein
MAAVSSGFCTAFDDCSHHAKEGDEDCAHGGLEEDEAKEGDEGSCDNSNFLNQATCRLAGHSWSSPHSKEGGPHPGASCAHIKARHPEHESHDESHGESHGKEDAGH